MVQPDGGFQILEFNARFGDPETQVVLPLLESDLADILVGITEARLHEVPVVFRPDAAVAVVMASAGYPGEYGTGYVIEGLGPVSHLSDVVVFQAGTARREDGEIVTTGGRVLAATGIGSDFEQARARAYAGVRAVSFDGAQYRTDIGYQADGHFVNEASGSEGRDNVNNANHHDFVGISSEDRRRHRAPCL